MPMEKDNRSVTRNLALVLGAVLLLWLPFEDTRTSWVSLLAVMICSLAGYFAVGKIPPEKRQRWYVYPITGVLAGLLVTPTIVLLMAFKSGIHGHGSPDFTPGQV